jgi:hypothetical protein
VSKIKQILKENNLQNDHIIDEEGQQESEQEQKDKKKKKSELKFPWWFKIFAYMLSFAFAGVSLFFVIVKGIEFGDEKVQKWLTSLLISFFTSLLVTQPIQVTFFLLLFFFNFKIKSFFLDCFGCFLFRYLI